MSPVPTGKSRAKPSYLRWKQLTAAKSKPTAAHAPSRQVNWHMERVKHDRQIRAKCRLLFAAGVPKEALVREFGGVLSTMLKVLHNDYSEKDVVADDLTAATEDPTFQGRFDYLRKNGFDNPNLSQRTTRRKKKRAVGAKEEADIPGGMGAPILIRSESPEQEQQDPVDDDYAHGPATPSPEPQDFLLTFLTKIGLQDLYAPLKDFGVDEDGLRWMSAHEEAHLDVFLVKIRKEVPQITPFTCLRLSKEIKQLAEVDMQ
ncbi:hypothetical protein C8R46DRAFT_1088421 [Mycena filopes]|nr:hypothetical protein C8R46DRAFT_1088421 [Mycena filopes]